ncbi:MAG: DNA methyltransferase [Deltaproteobacteria bacterium RIFOXYD12_FULL_50_9]|nr:MAG: DNA methyltransferase [Deltaproteobacteria bacterium RIFOXYD12_FULL_50_9]
MDKLKMQSLNLVDANIDKIAALFPNCITEDRDDNGTLRRVVDFDLLRQELSASLVEGPRERYTLTWPGKNEAILTANAPIAKTLRPCEEESVDFATTKNLFIEGDNLEVLKLLQETYLGKIKMIYIDPPYNTGNDFIYNDDFAEDTETFLRRSNQKDEAGNRMVANTDANGRFHSDWLTMIYPRLKLARNLLREDGAIFISIDDNEVHNLRKACDEVFGGTNFIATVIWQKVYSPKNSARHFSEDHDYIVIYARDAEIWRPYLLPRTPEMEARYANPDNDHRGPWKPGDLSARNYYSEGTYAITCPSGRIIGGPPSGTYWRVSKNKFNELDRDNRIWWGADGSNVPAIKRFLSEVKAGRVPQTLWTYQEVGHTQEAKKEIISLVDFPNSDVVFNTPKPTRLIRRILQLTTAPGEPEDEGQDDSFFEVRESSTPYLNASTKQTIRFKPRPPEIVLDFFAGTGTTMDAVFRQNAEDGGNRQCILVQLPEPIEGADHGGSLQTIADITKERLRCAGKRIKEEQGEKAVNLDIGFRVFKVDTSNLKDVYYTPDTLQQKQLDLFADHIKSDRRPEDLLFQVFLDWGLDLTLPIAKENIDDKTVFFVDGNALLACFDKGVNEELVKKLAKRKPLRAVFRDDAFSSDSVKINVEQIFKLLSPGTDVKSI